MAHSPVRSSIPRDVVAIGLAETEPAQQEVAGVGRHRPLDLEPDGLAEPPPAKLFLDREQKVVGLVLLDREVGVAGHPEEVVLLDLHAREQRVEVGLDDLVDEDEAMRLDLHEAGQDLRDLDPREPTFAGLRVAQPDGDRQGQRRDVREWMAWVHRERREDRKDLVEEALAKCRMVFRDRRIVDELDALGGEGPPDVHEHRRMLGDESEDALAGCGELLVGCAAVGRARDLAGLDLLAQAGDPDLEELIEIAGEDGQELDPLQEGIPGVARLVQDTVVEVQPGQLPVQVRERHLRARLASGTAGRHRADGLCESARLDGGHR